MDVLWSNVMLTKVFNGLHDFNDNFVIVLPFGHPVQIVLEIHWHSGHDFQDLVLRFWFAGRNAQIVFPLFLQLDNLIEGVFKNLSRQSLIVDSEMLWHLKDKVFLLLFQVDDLLQSFSNEFLDLIGVVSHIQAFPFMVTRSDLNVLLDVYFNLNVVMAFRVVIIFFRIFRLGAGAGAGA